jgi:thioredoxin-like negative regulator of GroEL
MTGTDWLTAIGILISGAIVGFMFVYSSRKPSRAPARALEVRDLEARRDALIAQLRELDDLGGPPEERARLEGEAAQVLRTLDGVAPARSGGSKGSSGSSSSSGATGAPPVGPVAKAPSAMKGFLWGAGSAAAVAGLIFFVMSSAKNREAGESPVGGGPPQSTGMTTTGSAQRPMQQGQQQADPDLQRLEAAVRAQPDNLSAADDLAKAYLERENMVAAFEQAKKVLDRKPDDARALTVQSIVLIAMGNTEQALHQLDTATKSDPKLIDAWVALAWAYTLTNHDDDAGKAIETAVKTHPDQEGRLRDILAKMRAQAKQPASGQASAEPSAAPASGPAVQVTISLAPGASAGAGRILFVFARSEGQTGGPPAAAKRIEVTSFPATIELSAADSMMGQPLPTRMRIEARLDADGVATTKGPGDLTAVQDGVVAGGNVALVLK